MEDNIKVLDNGYVRFIESWGRGEADEPEAAIIEAARQSTQGSFRGWDVWVCSKCSNQFSKKFDRHDISGGVDELDSGNLVLCDGKLSNDEALLSFLFKNSHSTPFEFCGMTIEIQAPILVFREWQRHRTQGYSEMSARYAPLPDFNYTPTKERLFLTQNTNKQAQALKGSEALTEDYADLWLYEVEGFYTRAEELYKEALNSGIPKELARIILPVGRYSRMRATANLRNWLGFLALRNHPDAQYEIREFAKVVAEIIKQQFPRTYSLFENKE